MHKINYQITKLSDYRMPLDVIVHAVVVGMAVALAGSIPRSLLFVANLRWFTAVPWAVPLTALYLWLFWRYLSGAWPRDSTAAERRAALRANPLPIRVWAWALLTGGLGIVALVLGLRLANRFIELPEQQIPNLSGAPDVTVLSLLLIAAPAAGIIEEAAFRGYMQGPIERRYGVATAILITGTMFAVAHLDFTLVLWPYYVAVAAIYGMVTYLTKSILPAVVLHTCGNLYSNFDLWLHGRAEWQASSAAGAPAVLDDASVAGLSVTLLILVAAAAWAGRGLARAAGAPAA
jgi:membrane protease YdiL (CAAX protease family)